MIEVGSSEPGGVANAERARVVAAFDLAAPGYDDELNRNPAALLFRYAVQERLGRLFRRGMRVLDLGCGTGEDALFLAEAGVSICGIDPSPAMVARARAKAEERGIPASRLRITELAAEDVDGLSESFDGAYSNFGALNCADVAAVGRGLARVLRSGAPVLLSWMGPHPLPKLLRGGLIRRARGHRPAVGGVPVTVHYPTFREVRRLMGPDFVWHTSLALGMVLPSPEHSRWPMRHPGLFGLASAFEWFVRGWPILRGLGDHLVQEGARR